MSNDEQYIKVRHVSRYMKDSSWLINLVLLSCIALIVGIAFFLLVQIKTRIEPKYFLVNQKNQLVDEIPLDKPTLTRPELLTWINNIMSEAFSFNYTNKHKQRARMAKYFEPKALDTYMEILEKDTDFAKMDENQLVVQINATDAPKIVQERILSGNYAAIIRIPARITFINSQMQSRQDAFIDFVIRRVDIDESADGVKVVSIIRKVNSRTGLRSRR